MRSAAAVTLIGTLLAACGPSVPPRNPVPLDLAKVERAAAMDDVRFFADAPFAIWARHLDAGRMGNDPTVLAISGGAEDGAFGAGVLSGWSERGDRPDFDLVTGVSTGALIAPFAFLGPAHDETLRTIYTTYGQDDLIASRGLAGLFGDALYDTSPMRTLVERHVTDRVIADIAQAHESGRRLLAVTTNLDAERAVVWDLGRIAQRGDGQLFRDVLMASASLPGLFPPVAIEVERDGQTYDELHADGGSIMQVLAVPEAAFDNLGTLDERGGALFLLVNNTLDPRPATVERDTFSIMGRAFSMLIKSHARGAVASASRFAARTGMDFRVASVGTDFDEPFDFAERFDLDYMRPLYAYGRAKALQGTAWRE